MITRRQAEALLKHREPPTPEQVRELQERLRPPPETCGICGQPKPCQSGAV